MFLIQIEKLKKVLSKLTDKKVFIPESGEWITLKVSTSALRTIDKNGITSVLKKALKMIIYCYK